MVDLACLTTGLHFANSMFSSSFWRGVALREHSVRTRGAGEQNSRRVGDVGGTAGSVSPSRTGAHPPALFVGRGDGRLRESAAKTGGLIESRDADLVPVIPIQIPILHCLS